MLDQASITAARDRLAWRLDWNLLRSFIAIVEERSFTAAAEKLDLKQPTISNALRRLEETLGCRLIERGPRMFEVTPNGEALYRQATEIFGAIERLPALLEREGDEVRGCVEIATATHVMTPILDQALQAFQQRHPAASISISVQSSRNVVEAVRSKRSAFGVCLIGQKVAGLDYTHLFTEHFGFFCGPTHPLFGKKGLTMDDLKNQRSVSFDTDQIHDVLRPIALLRERAQLAAEPAGVSNNLEEVRRMVMAGLGIAPLPIHVAARDVVDGLLWRLPPYENPPAIDIFVVMNPATSLNRAEQAFRDIFFERIRATPMKERTYGVEARRGPRRSG